MEAQVANWASDLLRIIVGSIDFIIYGLVKWVLFGIFDLANLTTSSDILNGVYNRIYVILGIFMAFKLSISFFQYIVEPDRMQDKGEKGVSKLILHCFLMIIALVALPKILFFGSDGKAPLISRAQTAFIPMLPRILLGINENTGVSVGNTNNGNDIEEASTAMTMATLQAFFSVPENIDDLCGSGTSDKIPPVANLEEFYLSLTLTCNKGINVSLGILGDIGASRYYKYHYSLVISTIVGVLLLLMLLSLTLDVAKRVFKLIILEVIAPIPIMSLIDPKSAKDKGPFSKWLHMLINTFVDIFIKLGILYLIIMLIQLIVSKGLFSNWPGFAEQPARSLYLTVLLILGLIFFAKEMPKFIKDSLGLDSSGENGQWGLGKVLAGAGVLAAAGKRFGSSIGDGVERIKNGQTGKGMQSILGAGFNSVGAGLRAAIGAGNGKKFGDIMGQENKIEDRRRQYATNGSTALGRFGVGAGKMFGNVPYSTKTDNDAKILEEMGKKNLAIKTRIKEEMVKSGKGVSFTDHAGNTVDYANYLNAYKNASSSGASTFTVGGYMYNVSAEFARQDDYEKQAIDSYVAGNLASDTVLQAAVIDADNYRTTYSRELGQHCNVSSMENIAIIDHGRVVGVAAGRASVHLSNTAKEVNTGKADISTRQGSGRYIRSKHNVIDSKK